MQMAANHKTEHWDPNGGVRGRTEGAKGVCNPIGRMTISNNHIPHSVQGLNHQRKSTHGGTHGSSCICSRGWPSWLSVRGEALGPVKALCPSVGECQGQEAGVGVLVSRGSGDRIGEGVFRGETKKGDII